MFDFFKKKLKEPKKRLNTEDIGSTGTINYSGFYSEEYFNGLLNDRAADVYDKMRRNDTQISLALSSIINSITSGRWRVDHYTEENMNEQDINTYKQHADFAQHVLFKDLDKPWSRKLKEILTCIIFGHSVFERVHKIVRNHHTYGDYIGIKKLGYRSQKSIYTWNFDKITKMFTGITQLAEGDLGSDKLIDIPAEDLLIFNIDSDGDNLEGISMLRQCYGSWRRKELYLKLMAIGMEKTAIGTPVGKYPSHEYGSTEYTNLKNALLSLTSHNRNYLMLPQRQDSPSYEVEIITYTFDSEKIKSAIEYEDMSIIRRFIAQFLMLGSSEGSGSWALSTDQSDFFLNGIVFIADMVAEVLNGLIKELTILNFGEQMHYPKLCHSRIRDKVGKEFAEVIKLGKDAGVIIPDDEMETFFREQYDMPKKQSGFSREEIEEKNNQKQEEVFNRQVEIAQKTQPKDQKFSEIKLAEKGVVKKINKAADEISKVYRNELKSIGDDLIEQVIKNFNDAKTDLQRVGAARNIQPRNVSKYRKALGATLKNISDDAIEDVISLVKDNTKLTEIVLAEKGSKGKKKADRYIIAQTDALVETQVSDVKNAVVLQFTSSINEDSAKRIKQDLDEKMKKKIDVIDNAKATVAATTVNKAREFVLYDKEIVEEIESFTFTNPSPKAPVCVSLNGKTFSVMDADSQRYAPPLHHNAVLGDTNVMTLNGNKKISEVTTDDYVKTHTGKFKRVYETMERFEDKIYYEIKLDNGNKVNITAEHPVLTKKGWKRVDALTLDDDIVCFEDV